MMRADSALTIACCALLPSAAIVAQDSTPSPTTVATTHRTHWCFRGRPKPACDVFWLTEFGVAARVGYNQPYESGPLFTWELGGMVNHGTRGAFGMAAFAQVGDGVGAVGIRPRLRYWITPTTSLDLAPGVVLHGSGRSPGFSGHIGLNFGDYAAVTAHVVALRPEPYDIDQRTRTFVFAGGRLGSVPGTIVGITAPIVLLIALVIACSSGGCFD
jgi:hypothetical protein